MSSLTTCGLQIFLIIGLLALFAESCAPVQSSSGASGTHYSQIDVKGQDSATEENLMLLVTDTESNTLLRTGYRHFDTTSKEFKILLENVSCDKVGKIAGFFKADTSTVKDKVKEATFVC